MHEGLGDAEGKVCLECHEDLAKTPEKGSVHPPFAEGACTNCHVLADQNRFKIVDMGETFCYMCHDEKNTKTAVHAPVASGDCVQCHNPHQSPNAALLREAPVSKLCFTCHDEAIIKHQFLHAPAAGGECTGCHDPHESPYPKQLVEEGDALCFVCHTDKEAEVKEKKNVHGAIDMLGCAGCHNPHGSGNKQQLSEKVPALCYDCHSEKEEKVKHSHGPMKDKKSCLNCHNPHASDFSAMTKAEHMDLCLSCHNRKRKTRGGYVMNMKTHLDRNKKHHGPIAMGDCSSCHDPHGSDEERMLKGTFPSQFYVPFRPEAYTLCFQCHDEALATDKLTLTATGFRNGEKNLHYTHVNDPEKGRRCAVCHDVHAAQGPKLIQEKGHFGKWEFDHNFEINENGGRCATGCHVPRTYNRSQTEAAR